MPRANCGKMANKNAELVGGIEKLKNDLLMYMVFHIFKTIFLLPYHIFNRCIIQYILRSKKIAPEMAL